MAKRSLEVDDERKEVRVNGWRVPLAPKEYMLVIVLRDAKKCLTRPDLLDRIWDVRKAAKIDTRTVDQHIARLRRKIEKAGWSAPIIETRTSFGYVWCGQ